MQDDLLMDKNKAQLHQHQGPIQVDPPSSTPTPSSEPAESEGPFTGSSQAASLSSTHRVPMESLVLPGLSFHQQPPQETRGPGASSPSSFGSTWSTGTTNMVEDGYLQGVSSMNGNMLFQNFPHQVNPVFGGSFSQQINSSRPPVSQGPFLQRNAYQTAMNNSKGSSSAWNNHQNAAWSSASGPWSGLQAGRDPRRAVGVGMPSSLSPVSPMKKPYSSNVIAPPKFPRPGPLAPRPWTEDVFRRDGGNILPLQASLSKHVYL